jgi:hypothetical protein
MLRLTILLFLLMGLHFGSRASHVLGGEITWQCQGGNYVFTLVFYRDCNGAEVNTVSETIRVWGHPTLTSITLPFVSRTDISPNCTAVAGSPLPLDCGTGTSGGNGIGALEKITYMSVPITIPGTPPATGWIFTYENFSRSNAVTNITNPSLYGITLSAKMYAIAGSTGGCVDSSPKFLQEPYFVSCSGSPYTYNMNAIDPDLDSIAVGFGIPYNHFPSGTYNPPINPVPVPFEPGFSYTSPTPGTAMNPSNLPAQINPSSGELTFTSFNTGNYVVKAVVRSYRNGVLIAEVEREMQLVVMACAASNTAPVITGPFSGLFETTVNAGTLVNFNLSSTDIEVLQDGSAQSNLLSASGPMFGTNFTAATGCAIAPCATLNTTPLITGVQGVNTTFNWQTSCDHLVGADGNAQDMIPYHFVFRVQDDFCQVPKVSYATITINVLNPGVIQAPTINCIHSNAAGDVTIEWTPVTDPLGTFVEYQVYSVQNGLLATIAGIGSSTFTDPGVSQKFDYYLAVVSGCNGNTKRFGDTLSNIYLELNNPSNGTAVLQWNDPRINPTPQMGDYYHIMREYPAGTWTFRDSVPYGLNFYFDTIDICEAYLGYQVVLPNQPCDYTSNITGDNFEDMITPDIPVISSVSIDTLSNELIINWSENTQGDTYGYVIYTYNSSGFLYELDTVWGISNTTYSYSTDITQGPLTYSVAAFDSCYTPSVPPTFQTSAKADIHTTMFLESELLVCSNEVVLSWTPYIGWSNATQYEIYAQLVGQPWQLIGSTNSTTYTADVIGLQEYCFFVKALNSSGESSFSNRQCLNIVAPTEPDYHYLRVATVDIDKVQLRHLIDASSGVTGVSFEKMNSNGLFEEIAQVPVTSNDVNYTDTDVAVNTFSYTYRARVIDSCGRPGTASNTAKTILVTIHKDEVRLLANVNWTAYEAYDGKVLAYNIYRGIDGVFSGGPIATLSSGELSFQDDLNDITFMGKVCYYIEAIEGDNIYGFRETSRSNIACEVFEPIIYIPNAFMPEGVNTTFKPVLTNFDPTEYRFTIFNRWGQVIFNSESPIEGWSGYIDGGNMAQTGTYLYMVELHDGNGIEIIRRGFVTLLK